jgi:hypothetical protein
MPKSDPRLAPRRSAIKPSSGQTKTAYSIMAGFIALVCLTLAVVFRGWIVDAPSVAGRNMASATADWPDRVVDGTVGSSAAHLPAAVRGYGGRAVARPTAKSNRPAAIDTLVQGSAPNDSSTAIQPGLALPPSRSDGTTSESSAGAASPDAPPVTKDRSGAGLDGSVESSISNDPADRILWPNELGLRTDLPILSQLSAGSWAPFQISETGRVLLGFECSETAVRPSVAQRQDLIGLSVREALDALVRVDRRYSWRTVDQVIVLRPSEAWTDPKNVLNQPVADIDWNDVTAREALARTMFFLAGFPHPRSPSE